MIMKTGARIALMAGLAGLIGLLVWQGVGDVAGVLVTAGWGCSSSPHFT